MVCLCYVIVVAANKEYLRRVRKEIEADLAAVDRLLDRAERAKTIGVLIEESHPRKSLSQMAEEIIQSIGKEFTVQDICFEIGKCRRKRSAYDSQIVSGIINKLRQRTPPEIEVVEVGRGCRSGVYRYSRPINHRLI